MSLIHKARRNQVVILSKELLGKSVFRMSNLNQDMLGYNGVLNTSMTLVVALYIAMGFYGYLRFGDAIDETITLNLPPSDM